MRIFPIAWAIHIPEATVEPAPVGELCALCETPIVADELGLFMRHVERSGGVEKPWHRACLLWHVGWRGPL